MTNIRFKGFDSPTQLREHLADVEEGASADDLAEDLPGEDELQSALREVAWLRKDVADLREQLALFPGQLNAVGGSRVGAYPWLRMGVAVLAAIVLGRCGASSPPGCARQCRGFDDSSPHRSRSLVARSAAGISSRLCQHAATVHAAGQAAHFLDEVAKSAGPGANSILST